MGEKIAISVIIATVFVVVIGRAYNKGNVKGYDAGYKDGLDVGRNYLR
jgi:hypothetical protein